MTPVQAAKEWLEVDPIYREAKRRREAAEAILKPHFRKTKARTFRGVAYACSSFMRLDATKARELLGKRASEAEVPSSRETLSAA